MKPIFAACIFLMMSVFLGVCGCDTPDVASYLYGHNLTVVEFVPSDENMGIHPNVSVLTDPENPFKDAFPGPETRWEINDHANHAAGFYSWATLLALQPTGENQFYVASKLRAIFEEAETLPEAMPYVREMALRAYTAVLEHFPASVTYDTTGTIPYALAPLALQALTELGGAIPPGWSLVQTPTGGVSAVFEPSDAAEAEEVEE